MGLSEHKFTVMAYRDNWGLARHVENERLAFAQIYSTVLAATVTLVSNNFERLAPLAIHGILTFLLLFSLLGWGLSLHWGVTFDGHMKCAQRVARSLRMLNYSVPPRQYKNWFWRLVRTKQMFCLFYCSVAAGAVAMIAYISLTPPDILGSSRAMVVSIVMSALAWLWMFQITHSAFLSSTTEEAKPEFLNVSKSEFVLEFYEENWRHARHQESERLSMTRTFTILAGMLLAITELGGRFGVPGRPASVALVQAWTYALAFVLLLISIVCLLLVRRWGETYDRHIDRIEFIATLMDIKHIVSLPTRTSGLARLVRTRYLFGYFYALVCGGMCGYVAALLGFGAPVVVPLGVLGLIISAWLSVGDDTRTSYRWITIHHEMLSADNIRAIKCAMRLAKAKVLVVGTKELLPEWQDFAAQALEDQKGFKQWQRDNSVDMLETIVLAFGEDDLPMVDSAGLSLALPGAHSNVMAAVDYAITEGQQSLCEIIERFISAPEPD